MYIISNIKKGQSSFYTPFISKCTSFPSKNTAYLITSFFDKTALYKLSLDPNAVDEELPRLIDDFPIAAPNPVKTGEQIKLNLKLNTPGSTDIYIFDLQGNEIFRQTKYLSAGENNLAIPGPLSSGAYFIYAFLPDGILRDKLIAE